ncbi:MAG: DNA translocase FtsK 4TM domain-containing protein [Patescibacteria group bacterium]
MPKKKSKKQHLKYENIKIDLDLNPETSREITAFIIAILILFIILSFLGQFGPIGLVVKTLLQSSFGYFSYLLPVFLIIFGLNTISPQKFPLATRQIISLCLFLIAGPGILNLFFDQVQPFYAGGYIGHGLVFICEKIIGQTGSIVLIFFFLILSFLLFFNTSLQKGISNFFQRLKQIRHKPKSNQIFHSQTEPTQDKPKISFYNFLQKKKKEIDQNADKESSTEKNSEVSNNSKTSTESISKLAVNQSTSEEVEINWQLPPSSLLEESKEEVHSGDINKNLKIIENTLSEFDIEVEMKDVNIGPTVTQYTFKPSTGVKLSKITSLQNDLALALAAHPIRVEAPIPGKSLVGIEIPNKKPAPVRLREIIESPSVLEGKQIVPIPLGRDISGLPALDDLTKMPHLLIAGSTGSGKSVFINTVIVTLLCRFTPEQIKFILVDPKRVELSSYNNLPHLLTPVVTEPKNALSALKWGLEEMNNRYKVLSANNARNILSYNQKFPHKPLPYIVIIIDELADLMMTAGNDIETAICRLAQMARATGIHLIVATQRPSVDVITGLIKANIATRIAFAVASQIDSRTILDMAGAEKLLGKGDMLYISRETGKPRRIQGVYVSDQEIDSITQFWKNEGPSPQYFQFNQTETESTENQNSPKFSDVDDDLFNQVVDLVLSSQQASASYLQRKLSIGYARAARLIDILEQKKIISTQVGNKPRQVLIKSLEEIK